MEDRTQALNFFLSTTDCTDEATAFMLLEDCNLENAVNTFFLMSDSGGAAGDEPREHEPSRQNGVVNACGPQIG